ncbi:hypothetical protein [Sphingobacterium sp. UME9]|uniref:hypothetical protein n=1 Tax=Sphingobacterium sp. UME9 TaxID=1862316 RepID=UPI001600D7DB|nr:hypothetical protein [Sphingobacterium sp. UME9]MBB1646642.1 hypothetical protein [Sphingobacterium sp. UME9]
MIKSSHPELFQHLKNSIENKLEWGETSNWSTADFEKLSEKIQEKTGVILSISTLKRIFGRIDYQSKPALTTLNTLAQYLGYEDWRAFRNAYVQKEISQNQVFSKSTFEPQVSVQKKYGSVFIIGISSVIVLVVVLLFGNRFVQKKKHFDGSAFHFSSKTMLTQGLPNSVVFDYDASAASEDDSVFIAQSWDTSRKTQVDRNDKHHSAIYYYPGYFRAKLIIGDKIVREHDIQIKTDGWLGLVEAAWGKEPLYFKKTEITLPHEIAVTQELLKSYKVDLLPEAPPVRFYNQKNMTGVMTNNFSFETDIKTGIVNSGNICQRVEVLLQSKNDIFIIPLVNTACIGDIALTAGGFYTDSKQDDLSGFGCDLSEWTKLKIVCKNQQIRFWINDKHVYATTIKNAPTEIVGLQYRFKGAGFVRNTRLSGSEMKDIIF